MSGPVGPRWHRKWCRPLLGDLGEYGPVVEKLDNLVRRQQDDLSAHLSAWIERQDKFVEDLLQEVLAFQRQAQAAEHARQCSCADAEPAPAAAGTTDREVPDWAVGTTSGEAWEQPAAQGAFGNAEVNGQPEVALPAGFHRQASVDTFSQCERPWAGIPGAKPGQPKSKSGSQTLSVESVRLSASVETPDRDGKPSAMQGAGATDAKAALPTSGSQCFSVESTPLSQAGSKAASMQEGRVTVSGARRTRMTRSAASRLASRRSLFSEWAEGRWRPEDRWKQKADSARHLYLYGKDNSALRLRRSRSYLVNVLKSAMFEKLVGAMIILSSVAVGVEVQLCAVALTEEAPLFLQFMQIGFCAFFVIELAVRWLLQGRNFLCGLEWNWNLFDAVIVFLSLVDQVMIYLASEGNPILIVTRMIRIVRIVRIIRVVRYMRELKLMIYSIYHTLKSLIWSLVLMLLIMYLFAVYMTQATTHHLVAAGMAHDYAEDLLRYWGTLPNTAYTLFMCMSGGVSWGDPVDSLVHIHWSAQAMFLLFISFTLFAFLNVITGFFCVSASDISTLDKEQIIVEQLRDRSKYTEEFASIFNMIDVDASGDISLQELEGNLEDPALQAYFAHLNLDVAKAWDIFKLLDNDGSGTVSIEEFVEGCLRLRGGARSIDVAVLAHESYRLKNKLAEFMQSTEGFHKEVAAIMKEVATAKKSKQAVQSFAAAPLQHAPTCNSRSAAPASAKKFQDLTAEITAEVPAKIASFYL